MKKNLQHNLFICGTCSDVDRLKLPQNISQKCDLVRGIFEMTNDIVTKGRTQLFLFLPHMKAHGAWRVLEISQRYLGFA